MKAGVEAKETALPPERVCEEEAFSPPERGGVEENVLAQRRICVREVPSLLGQEEVSSNGVSPPDWEVVVLMQWAEVMGHVWSLERGEVSTLSFGVVMGTVSPPFRVSSLPSAW